MAEDLSIVILGLSITSSWGNGHATTFRGLVRELAARGHHVLFLERDRPWYAANRDLPAPEYCETAIYSSVEALQRRFASEVRRADFVMVGSYVPDGIDVGEWVTATATGVTAFYDIDTPVTLVSLECGDAEYLSRALVRRYRMYLSFTGGPTLRRIETEYGSPLARPLYCSVDPAVYFPDPIAARWDLGYMGTYSEDRQPTVERLMLAPARSWTDGRFVIAGPQYPTRAAWPANLDYIEHLAPDRHCRFYNRQRFTLNVTRTAMVAAGYSPSVRLFEAAACEVPIISDYWPGLESFFTIGSEILVARSADEVLRSIRKTPEAERLAIARRARTRVLAEHTAAHRAAQLESYVVGLLGVQALAGLHRGAHDSYE
jgi:spore maturation protein CgeB